MALPRHPLLPDGDYGFGGKSWPIGDMAFAEAPAELEAFLRAQAEAQRITIIRDLPIELVCRSEAGDQVFWIWWPTGGERMHILTPAGLISGRA